MYRKPPPDNPRLQALLDERDHIRIRISLLLDSSAPDETKIEALYKQLDAVEERIAASERDADTPEMRNAEGN